MTETQRIRERESAGVRGKVFSQKLAGIALKSRNLSLSLSLSLSRLETSRLGRLPGFPSSPIKVHICSMAHCFTPKVLLDRSLLGPRETGPLCKAFILLEK